MLSRQEKVERVKVWRDGMYAGFDYGFVLGGTFGIIVYAWMTHMLMQ